MPVLVRTFLPTLIARWNKILKIVPVQPAL